MTARSRLDQHHVESLSQLVEGHMEELLGEVFPVDTRHGKVELGSVTWPDPVWMSKSDQPRWMRTLEFGIRVAKTDATVEDTTVEDTTVEDTTVEDTTVKLDMLWPLDDRALTDRDPPAWVRLGGQNGLIDGRPLVPLSQRSFKPGLHILRDNRAAGGRRLVLVPDAGASFSIEPRAMTPGDHYRARAGRACVVVHSMERSPLTDWPPFKRLIGRDGPATAHFRAGTVAQIEDALRAPLAESTPDSYWQRLVRLHEGTKKGLATLPCFRRELSDAVLVTRHYGDLIERSVLDSVLAGVRQFHNGKLSEPNELAKLIKRQFTQRFRQMRYGGNGLPQLLVADDDRSTLANLERRRTVTRYSPGLRRGAPHELWTRDIHSDDRNRLCPLQTPESQDIGHVRFLALGDPGEGAELPSDLSAAASLIPFLNHNDPARSSIGSKNLKQALPLEGLSAPRIRSGTETLLAEAHGVARSPVGSEARVAEVTDSQVVLTPASGGAEVVVSFGPPGPTGYSADSRWTVTVAEGDTVDPGQVLAHAPDVVMEPDGPMLVLGTDVLVAYTPWHGMNYEDAIVVSDGIVDRFASRHLLSIRELCPAENELGVASADVGDRVNAGDELAIVLSTWDGCALRTVTAPDSGEVASVVCDHEAVTIGLRTRRPLAVGDKLTNRHGGKGVVSQIVPTSEMPALPDGRRVEMLLNPIGVIRRLNVGQLLEAHVSLLDDLTGAGPRVVGRRLFRHERQRVAARLRELGAPGGRLPLRCADRSVLDRHGGVVVGWQHMLKLDHLATDKRRERLQSSVSRQVRQPAKGGGYQGGHRRGGAQRTGEMEIWALLASGADTFLEECLTERSRLPHGSNPTLDSVGAHLAVGQIGLDRDGGSVYLLDQRDTRPFPNRKLLDQIRQPRTFGGSPDRDSDPLYAEIHGHHDPATCSCGRQRDAGKRCSRCHTIARLRDRPRRSSVLYHVGFDVPMRHPWFPFPRHPRQRLAGNKLERLRRKLDRALTAKQERREHALDAARRSGFEPTVGLELENGWIVALNEKSAWISAEGGVTTFGIAGTLLDGVVDLAVDPRAQRAFVLLANRLERQITELDLSTGEFVRNWTIDRRHKAKSLQLVTLSARGWPAIWDRDYGRCVCVPMLHVLPLLPPGYRAFGLDALDNRYRELIIANNLMSAGRGDPTDLARCLREVLGGPGDEPDALTVSGRLNSKMGLIRRGLRGRRNDAVARNVVVPDTGLGLEEVGLPDKTVAELELGDGDVVVVNRQPTLRPYNVVTLRAKRHSGDYVALHPFMSKQLAGDFDGDEITLHRPVSTEATQDAWQRLRPTAALLSDADGRAVMGPDLDVALGLHTMSQGEEGRLVLAERFAQDVPADLTGKEAEDLVADWYGRMAEEQQAEAATQIKELFALAVGASTGWSASVLELSRMDGDSWDSLVAELEDGGVATGTVPDWLTEALRAGVAGSPQGVKQLLSRRGALRTFTGDLHVDLSGCFLDGLNDYETFVTAAGSLATLADKKLVTPQAGHLTKRLADAMHDVVVAAEDCGCTDAHRSPLACRLDGDDVCVACVGRLASGRTVEIGERIGLRAAMLIGERCTQKAMKTFQSGGTNQAVAGAVETLEAIFGPSLRNTAPTDLAEQAYDALDGEVDTALLCVVLRRLLRFRHTERPLDAARLTGDAIVDASTLGRLSHLLNAVGRARSRTTGPRADHVYGVPL